MRILAVETATSRLSVAVLDGDTPVCFRDRDATGHHAKYLLSMIDIILEESQYKLVNLNGLAVSGGPGSFTGLRVGLATMMGLRMVTGLPLVVVPTLEAMAWSCFHSTDPVCPILKARTGEVYWSVYRWNESRLLQVTRERVGSIAECATSLPPGTVVYGEGWDLNRDQFTALGVKEPAVSSRPGIAASAEGVARASLERFRRGEVAGVTVSPFYVQRAEAEVQLERRRAAQGGRC